jgi:hypothetical protein
MLMSYPAWNKPDVLAFLEENPPKAIPSIINTQDLTLIMDEQN